MNAIVVFFTSLAAIVFLVGFKHWERKRGAIVAARARERADIWVVNGLIRAERGIRYGFRFFVRRVVIRSVHTITLVALHVVRFLESQLVSIITLIRGRHTRSRRDEDR